MDSKNYTNRNYQVNAKNISDILEVLAVRFGTTVEHLWAVLIRQVYVDAIVNVSAGIAFTVAAIIVSRIVYRWHTVVLPPQPGYANGHTFEYTNEGLAVTAFIAAILLCILAVICDAFAVGSLAQLANPEYGALKMLGAALNPSK